MLKAEALRPAIEPRSTTALHSTVRARLELAFHGSAVAMGLR